MMRPPPTASRDIWSHGSGTQLRDLISSSLATLLLLPSASKPVYFSSPWISNFVLLDNQFGQFSSVFPELDLQAQIHFTEYLAHLGRIMPVRLIAVANDVSKHFLASLPIGRATSLEVRYAPEEHHEKGILTPWFYVEGSMNLTYHGVYIRGEKITYHTAAADDGREKIARAYLEFDRYWSSLR